jgi:hypothetical protein
MFPLRQAASAKISTCVVHHTYSAAIAEHKDQTQERMLKSLSEPCLKPVSVF